MNRRHLMRIPMKINNPPESIKTTEEISTSISTPVLVHGHGRAVRRAVAIEPIINSETITVEENVKENVSNVEENESDDSSNTIIVENVAKLENVIENIVREVSQSTSDESGENIIIQTQIPSDDEDSDCDGDSCMIEYITEGDQNVVITTNNNLIFSKVEETNESVEQVEETQTVEETVEQVEEAQIVEETVEQVEETQTVEDTQTVEETIEHVEEAQIVEETIEQVEDTQTIEHVENESLNKLLADSETTLKINAKVEEIATIISETSPSSEGTKPKKLKKKVKKLKK